MTTTLKLVALSALAFTVMTGCTGDSVQPTAAGSAYTPDDVAENPTPGRVRPIEEFLSMQGTYCQEDGSGGCQLYAQPVNNHLAFYDPQRNKMIMVDYAGSTNMHMADKTGRDFDTKHDGEVREEPMPDGRVMVTVTLNTSSAIAYVVNGTDLMRSPMMIGTRPIDLMNPESKPALGSASLTFSYVAPGPGLPIPDMIQLIRRPQPGQEMREMKFDFSGFGTHFSGKDVGFSVVQHGPVMPFLPGAEMMTPPTAHATFSFY